MTNSWSRIGVVAGFLGLVLQAVTGCSAATDAGETVETEEQGIAVTGPRCTVTGSPPITQGCSSNQVCQVLACTNSIPPACFGTCAPAGCVYGFAKDCCGNLACRPGPKLPPPCPIFCPNIQ